MKTDLVKYAAAKLVKYISRPAADQPCVCEVVNIQWWELARHLN